MKGKQSSKWVRGAQGHCRPWWGQKTVAGAPGQWNRKGPQVKEGVGGKLGNGKTAWELSENVKQRGGRGGRARPIRKFPPEEPGGLPASNSEPRHQESSWDTRREQDTGQKTSSSGTRVTREKRDDRGQGHSDSAERGVVPSAKRQSPQPTDCL